MSDRAIRAVDFHRRGSDTSTKIFNSKNNTSIIYRASLRFVSRKINNNYQYYHKNVVNISIKLIHKIVTRIIVVVEVRSSSLGRHRSFLDINLKCFTRILFNFFFFETILHLAVLLKTMAWKKYLAETIIFRVVTKSWETLLLSQLLFASCCFA